MKNSKSKIIILRSSIFLLLGIVLIILGIRLSEYEYAGLLLAVGSALSAISLLLLTGLRASDDELKKFEEKKRMILEDERNIRIREKTGYMCNKIISYCLAAVTIIISFMEINKIAMYLVASLLFIQMILDLVIGCYYSKRI